MAKISAGVAERLRPPRPQPGLLDRASLVERVLIGLEGQVALVRAPPGFGKTELLGSVHTALRQQGDKVAWLALDPSDAAPATFASNLARAVLDADPPEGPVATLDGLLDVLQDVPSERLHLILDGVGPCHAAVVGGLLRLLPGKVRLALAVSGDVELPLSRLRLRQLLTEIGAADLAFSRAETRRLLGTPIASADFDIFHAVTGGWPALVRLGATRFAAEPDGIERNQIMAGRHRDYRAFLRDELRPGIGPEIARFIEVTAFLNEIPIELGCELAALSTALVTAALDALVPLMEALPHRPGWVALHPVIRAATLAEIEETEASIAASRDAHSRAALWFAAHGHIEKSVHHAGLAGDFAFAAETIRTAGGVSLFLRVGYRVLHRLMGDIPREIVDRSRGLQLCAALVLAKEGQLQAARERIDALKRVPAGSQSEDVPEDVLRHIDGLLDIYEDCRIDQRDIDAMEARLRGLPLQGTWVRGWLHNHLCIAYTRHGYLRQARLHALKALDCYREENAAYAQSFLLIHLSFVNLLGGRISAATAYSRQAEDLIQRTQWSDDNLLAIARIPVAETLYQQGQIRAADATLAEALPVVARGEGWVDVFASGFVTYARCRHRLEGTVAALGVVDRAEELAEDRKLPRLGLVAQIVRVEILTREGLFDSADRALLGLPDPEAVEAWSTRRENREARVAMARLMLRRGQIAEAESALDSFDATRREEDDALVCLTAEILWAETALERGDMAAAIARLNRAVAAAQPQNITEPFAAEGKPFQDMVRTMVRHLGLAAFGPKVAAFVNRILAMRPDGTSSPRAGILSERERDVLVLLGRGLSNKEIAREIGISEATAKFHLKGIFAKLGASRRTMAVSVAKATGLLPP